MNPNDDISQRVVTSNLQTEEIETQRVPFPTVPRFNQWCFTLALLLQGTLIFSQLQQSGWVLGDGGLFWAMTRAIVENGFALPGSVTYPTLTESIPFCYPPLAFYITAVLNSLGISLDNIFRILPFGLSLLQIWFFWRLARTLFRDSLAAGASTLMWSLLPNAFFWHIQGGGLPRALGFCFALGAIEAGLRLWRDEQDRAQLTTAIFLGLTVVTHLERAHFAFLALLTMWICYRRTGRGVAQLGIVILGALILSSPYWVTNLLRYSLDPFLNAASAGSAKFEIDFTYLAPIVAAMFCLRRRFYFVPLWAVSILFLEVRSSFIFLMVPFALGLGAAIEGAVPPRWAPKKQHVFAVSALATFTLCLLLDNLGQPRKPPRLTEGMRIAMNWSAKHTPPEAQFLVLPSSNWALDLNGEWFPALAERTSVSTVQGAEWLSRIDLTDPSSDEISEFKYRIVRHETLLKCASLREIEEWRDQGQVSFNWILVPAHPESNQNDESFAARTHTLRNELQVSSAWRQVYGNASAVIFQRMKNQVEEQ